MPSIILVGSEDSSQEYIRSFVSEHDIAGFNIFELSEKVKIENIKTVVRTFTIKSSKQQKRLVILPGTITLPAQNALLKFLEELDDLDFVVFKTQSVDMLIPTIHSRSRIIPLEFQGLSVNTDCLAEIERVFRSGPSEQGLLRISERINSQNDYADLVVALRQYVIGTFSAENNSKTNQFLISLLKYLHVNFQLVTENNVSPKATVEAYTWL